jgi:hypothetical protein
MGDWLGYLQTAAKAKTGISVGVVIGGVLAAGAAFGTLVWLSITLFIWVAERYDNLTIAGLVLSGLYFCVALIALVTAVTIRSLNARRAERELETRKAAFSATLLSGGLLSGGLAPTLLSAGLQVGRTVGWRRLVMMAGVALLTTGLVREWTARRGDGEGEEPEGPPSEP